MRHASILAMTLVIALGSAVAVRPAPRAAFAQDDAGQAAGSISRDEEYRRVAETFPMEPPRHEGGQVILGMASDVSGLHPFFFPDTYSGFAVAAIYQTLVWTSVVDGRLVPGLADSWEIAADGATYTFHLNRDARWHDGGDFTADDVVFTFDAALDPETAAPYRSLLDQQIASYRVVDPDTVEFVSEGPLAVFLTEAMSLPIVPKHLWESVPFGHWPTDPGSTGQDPSRVVGTGAFKFKEWVQGDHLTLVRNDEYWDVVPVVEEFVLSVHPDKVTAIQALRAGEVDIVESLPAADVERLAESDGLAVATHPTTSFVTYVPNLDPARTTLFQDQRVRAALLVALDRQAIVDTTMFGFGAVAQGTHHELSAGYAPDRIETRYDHDPERSKRLLAEAGWIDTNGNGTVDQDGEEFAFELIHDAGNPERVQMAAYMQEAWRAIGVDATPRGMPFPALLEMLQGHDFEMGLLRLPTPPTGSQGFLFRCDAYDIAFNVMKYCNPRYDELDDQQVLELDPERRKELLIQLANIVWNDLPVGVLAFEEGRTGYSTRLHNFHPNGYSVLWSLAFVWVDE